MGKFNYVMSFKMFFLGSDSWNSYASLNGTEMLVSSVIGSMKDTSKHTFAVAHRPFATAFIQFGTANGAVKERGYDLHSDICFNHSRLLVFCQDLQRTSPWKTINCDRVAFGARYLWLGPYIFI